MKKFEMILCMMFLVVLVAVGSIIPNQALAVIGDDSLFVPGDAEYDDDLIMEQSGTTNDGTSGDPDSIGDGFNWGGDSALLGLASGFIDGFEVSLEEYICYLMRQIEPLQ